MNGRDNRQLQLRQLTDTEKRLLGKYRLQQGEVQAPTRSIADSDGLLGFPAIAVDTLAKLETNGTITAGMRAAGEAFCFLFQRAGLDAMRASDLSRVPVEGGHRESTPGAGAEQARRRILGIVGQLGGITSPGGSVLWHVCGLEWSLRRWALETRRPNQVASGILIASLGSLQGQLEGRRR